VGAAEATWNPGARISPWSGCLQLNLPNWSINWRMKWTIKPSEVCDSDGAMRPPDETDEDGYLGRRMLWSGQLKAEYTKRESLACRFEYSAIVSLNCVGTDARVMVRRCFECGYLELLELSENWNWAMQIR
jgi:hypothetical protein